MKRGPDFRLLHVAGPEGVHRPGGSVGLHGVYGQDLVGPLQEMQGIQDRGAYLGDQHAGRGSRCKARTAWTPTPSSFSSRFPNPAIRIRSFRLLVRMMVVMPMIQVTMFVAVVLGANLRPAVVVVQGENLLPLLRTHHVNRAGEAGVEGVDYAHHLDGLLDIRHRGADEGFFDGARWPPASLGDAFQHVGVMIW